MALGLLIHVSLVLFLLLTGNAGQVTKKAQVYRLLDDTRNFEEYDIPSTRPYVKNMEDDAGHAVNYEADVGESLPFKLDVSQYRPSSGSLFPNRPVKPNRPHVMRLINGKPGEWKLQDDGRPLTFPSKPNLRPQVHSRDRTWFEPGRQSPSHPYTNRHVQGTFNAPPNAGYNWVPVVSSSFNDAGSQTNDFGATEGSDSTSPYGVLHDPLANSYGGPLNKPGNKQDGSPASYPAYTQTGPEGQGPSLPKRNYAQTVYQPRYDQMSVPPRESIVGTQPSPQRGRQLDIPRYVVQSRHSYQNNRHFGSKLSYDPKVWQ